MTMPPELPQQQQGAMLLAEKGRSGQTASSAAAGLEIWVEESWEPAPLDPEVERALIAQDERERPRVLRRIRWISIGAALVAGLLVLWLRDVRAFVGLTCAAALTIINFLWLEDTVTTVLRASPHPSPFKLSIRVLARFVLLGVALSAAIYVAHFDALSVVGGFSVVVLGVMGEALLSLLRILRDR